MKTYKIFQERNLPFLKGLISIAVSKGQNTIMSPFDMEDIQISKVREYIDSIEENEDMD